MLGMTRIALAAAMTLSATVAAAEIVVTDAYIRSATPTAPTGAAFMTLENTGADSRRLVSVGSDIAERVELHTHVEDENGMMSMRPIEGGIDIAPGAAHSLARGGDHVMFLGLTVPLEQGETVPLTLGFDDGTEIDLDLVVDRERQGGHGMQMNGKAEGSDS